MRNLEQIIASLRRHRPSNVEDLLNDCKLTLTFVSDGAYRNVYEISEAPCVVKVPKFPDSDGCEHSTKEYLAWRLITGSERFAHVSHLMPTIYYHNRKTGIIADAQL